METCATSPKSVRSRKTLEPDKPGGGKSDNSPKEADYDSAESDVDENEHIDLPTVDKYEYLYKTLGGRRLFKKEDLRILDEQLDIIIRKFKNELDDLRPLDDKSSPCDPRILKYKAVTRFRDVFGNKHTFIIPYI